MLCELRPWINKEYLGSYLFVWFYLPNRNLPLYSCSRIIVLHACSILIHLLIYFSLDLQAYILLFVCTLWEIIVQVKPTFNYFLPFHPYKLKFETLLDTFKIHNFVVLVCQYFIFWRVNDVTKLS